ncbi:MAG: hypothetical protein LBC79_00010 [Deltaproteobacteria bacterium]|jgi:hypothetical protein|nr:hypothetical protein [Deltaproteobacteria bacterium]
MKYLIMEDFSGQPVVFIFPRRVDHLDMREQLPYKRALAAGYVELQGSALRCFGGDAGMDLHARQQDAELIRDSLLQREN